MFVEQPIRNDTVCRMLAHSTFYFTFAIGRFIFNFLISVQRKKRNAFNILAILSMEWFVATYRLPLVVFEFVWFLTRILPSILFSQSPRNQVIWDFYLPNNLRFQPLANTYWILRRLNYVTRRSFSASAVVKTWAKLFQKNDSSLDALLLFRSFLCSITQYK